MITRFIRVLPFLAALVLALASCASAPEAVPPDLDASTLVQRAQEAADDDKWDTAILYYEALKERFGADPALLAASLYEIAFVEYKRGNTDEARRLFTELLALYAGAPPGAYPDRFRVLAEKLLAKLK